MLEVHIHSDFRISWKSAENFFKSYFHNHYEYILILHQCVTCFAKSNGNTEIFLSLYLACILAPWRGSCTDHAWSDTSIWRIGTITWGVTHDLYCHLSQSGAGGASLLQNNNPKQLSSYMALKLFVTWQKEKCTQFLFENMRLSL
jgi:hypothetical protein